MLMYKNNTASLFLGLFLILLAVSPFGEAGEEALWLRNTAFSPDGSEIAFTYKGNAYKVPVSGGIARMLVMGENNYVSNLRWSPDGDWIAMSITINGDMDVYIVPAKGGEIRRLTWNLGKDAPLGFASDGKSVLISARQLTNAKSDFYTITPVSQVRTQVFTVPVEGGKLRPVLQYPAIDASLNSDDTRLVYTAGPTYEQHYRKHQQSWASPTIMIYDRKSNKHKTITPRRMSTLNPLWAENDKTIYYLSEQSGSFNVWRYDTEKDQHRQITRHDTHPVRHLSIAQDTGDLVYSFDGRIYVRKANATKSNRLRVVVQNSSLPLTMYVGAATVTDFNLRPRSQELVVASMGDLFLLDARTGQTKDLVRNPQEEAHPQFTPSGSTIIFSAQRNKRWGIYAASMDEGAESFFESENVIIEPIIEGDYDAMQPLISPDGTKIAYLRNRNALYVFDGENHIEIIPQGTNYSYVDGDISYSWAPDSAHLATVVEDTFFNREIHLYSVKQKPVNIRLTYNDVNDYEPLWHMSGESIFFGSSIFSSYSAQGDRNTVDVFQIFLSKQFMNKGAPEATQNDQQEQKVPVIDLDKLDPMTVPKLARRVTVGLSDIYYYAPVLQGTHIFAVGIKRLFGGEPTVLGFLISLETGQTRQIFDMPAYIKPIFRITADGSATVFYDGRGFNYFNFSDETGNAIGFRLSAAIPLDGRIKAIFDHYWQFTKNKFYDPDMNGVDWDKYGQQYRKFLDHIDDPDDMAIILSEMVGELNSSHTGGRYQSDHDQEAALSNSFLGAIYNLAYKGQGFKIDEIISGGPLDSPDLNIQPGDIITAVDGTPVPDNGGINKLLHGKKHGVKILLRVKRHNKEWLEKVSTISMYEEQELLYERWTEKRRNYVIEKSGGKLGYVHVKSMDSDSFRKTTAEVIGRFRHAKGMVVDVRFNPGGNLHDSLVTLLTGKKYLYWAPKDTQISFESRRRFTEPSVLLANASSYSDGSVFAQAYKDLAIGKLVGDPIPGTGTAVWYKKSPIIPGMQYGIPQMPLTKLDGTRYENLEIVPDVLSNNGPAEVQSGIDRQLDDAIRVLMETIDK